MKRLGKLRPWGMAAVAASACTLGIALVSGGEASASAGAPHTAASTSVVYLPASAPSVAGVPQFTIRCVLKLNQRVHWSNPGNDVSWHPTYLCDDGDVTAEAAMQLNQVPFQVASTSEVLEGAEGQFNIRWDGCASGTKDQFYGEAQVEFSAPNHYSRTASGHSPTTEVTCK